MLKRSWSHQQFDAYVVRPLFSRFYSEILDKEPKKLNPFFDEKGDSSGASSLEEYLPHYCLVAKASRKLQVVPTFFFDGVAIHNTCFKSRRNWTENELYLGAFCLNGSNMYTHFVGFQLPVMRYHTTN